MEFLAAKVFTAVPYLGVGVSREPYETGREVLGVIFIPPSTRTSYFYDEEDDDDGDDVAFLFNLVKICNG